MKKEFGACKWLLVLYNRGTNHDSKTSQRRRGNKIHDVFVSFFSVFGRAFQNNKQQGESSAIFSLLSRIFQVGNNRVGRSVGLDAAVCILERVRL